ncbi:MAG: hypothetical protein U0837_03910 [Dehalococcoidia bacterium]
MTDLAARLAPTIGGQRRVFCCHSATLSGRFSPNSLQAVKECVAAGVPRLEIDVQFLADDAMAIHHDPSFSAHAQGSVKLAELARGAMDDFGHRGGERIAFLEDVVEAVAGSATLLQVDLKLSRPISPRRVELLEETLRPLEGRLVVGSQAHWNLRRLRGVPVALDPTLHWAFAARPPGIPHSLGVHGLWDDSPIASNPRFNAYDYVHARVDDLLSLVPGTVEWMVDIGTIFTLAELGVALGETLRERGVALAAWTLRGSSTSPRETLMRLFELGVETVITDIPELAAGAVL